jgi:hypothetical protein
MIFDRGAVDPEKVIKSTAFLGLITIILYTNRRHA